MHLDLSQVSTMMLFQVISYASVTSPSHGVSTPGNLASSSTENISAALHTTDERPTHIAFGKKVAIPGHILAKQQVRD